MYKMLKVFNKFKYDYHYYYKASSTRNPKKEVERRGVEWGSKLMICFSPADKKTIRLPSNFVYSWTVVFGA